MMTGDSERTAAAIAKRVGVDEYYAEVLPEDKANYIEKCRARGSKVIMVGAEIAREIADITVAADDLYQLVILKNLSNLLMKRIHRNYRVIVGFNTGLIGLGVAGILQPTTSALLHNTSTLLISLNNMKPLLNEETDH